jgi:glyoxylase-like metal-dependent hydrolase (beta-lactamase superfamily II)
VDLVVLTHAHEDHVAGVHLFGHSEVVIHGLDHQGIASLDGLMAIYGMEPDVDAYFRQVVIDEFTYASRPDASNFANGAVFDLGGVTLTMVHLPGHTAGHCGVLIEPDAVFVTGDIDLSGFGPYYGDATSSLDDFERSLAIARDIDARWYSTFHHKGVIDGAEEYRAAVDVFTAVIDRREQAMVEFMTGTPRTLEDLVARRFVYRPHVTMQIVSGVERRSAEMSLVRLAARGAIREVEPGNYLAG